MNDIRFSYNVNETVPTLLTGSKNGEMSKVSGHGFVFSPHKLLQLPHCCATGKFKFFFPCIMALQLQVLCATDPLVKWREGVGVGINRDDRSSSSKLLRPEVPLSKHRRGNKLASAIVNTHLSIEPKLEVPFRGREVVAYDDIL